MATATENRGFGNTSGNSRVLRVAPASRSTGRRVAPLAAPAGRPGRKWCNMAKISTASYSQALSLLNPWVDADAWYCARKQLADRHKAQSNAAQTRQTALKIRAELKGKSRTQAASLRRQAAFFESEAQGLENFAEKLRLIVIGHQAQLNQAAALLPPALVERLPAVSFFGRFNAERAAARVRGVVARLSAMRHRSQARPGNIGSRSSRRVPKHRVCKCGGTATVNRTYYKGQQKIQSMKCKNCAATWPHKSDGA